MTNDRSLARGLLAVAAVLGLTLGASLVMAAPPPKGAEQQAREVARTFGKRGFELFEAGDYEGAIGQFQQAEENFHAPTHWLLIARSQAKLGRLLEAEKSYKLVLVDELDRSAPKAFTAAQDSAREELASLRSRIPEVSVDVLGIPEGATAEVFLDGTRLDAGPRGSRARVDPGSHQVRVTAPTMAPVERDIEVAEGADQRVLVELQPARYSAGVIPGAIAIGLGAVGLGLGTVTGAMSLSRVGDLDQSCPSKRCSPAEKSIADEARTLGTVSTIGFVAGGVLAAAGVTLLVLRPGSGTRASTSGQAVQVNVAASPNALIVRGVF
ncbi:hypothetical protein [Chondromyces crocatus]|uniref:PEGA domain-containing protein n=1 Tax=Chondromyces crocatus TaxID=52 RepID=A0A0K1ER40_CHOCO|nr:hypothetical protein [Chondromyces crocatus]AKT43112.1 uncharacterized protein CMC5_073400 [Chondromyces crocatus]